jgi:uncharacterized protein YdeI (YjbR/CyaY-like superfamily)
MAKSSGKTFKATLKPDGTPLKWTIVSVPRGVTDGWEAGGRPRVKGEINGFVFRTTLFPTGKGDFVLLVNKRMQAGGKVVLGSVASFRLEPDAEERTIDTPQELKQALSGVRGLRQYYEGLSYSFHKYISDMVTAPKDEEARARRAEQMAEVLLFMKEGERQTPPILEAAFVRAPLARKGWELMTPTQRRGHLWGISYYRSPESRQKRTMKAVEEAVRIAKAKGKLDPQESDSEL